MAFHPIPARWFEILVPRRRVAQVMENLARTRQVEFEAVNGAERHDLAALGPFLAEYGRLRHNLESALPAPDISLGTDDRPLEAIAEDALGRLRLWAEQAEPLVRALEVAVRQEAELATLHQILFHLANLDPKLVLTDDIDPGGPIRMRLFLLPHGCEVDLQRDLTVGRVFDVTAGRVVLAAGTAHSLELLTRDLAALNARRLDLPEWAKGPVTQARDEARQRLDACTGDSERIRLSLDGIVARHRIPAALGDMIRVAWVADEMEHFPVTENLGWITGWTSARGEEPLRRPLERMGLPFALSFAEPPPGKTPPSILFNPSWVRPFELFARLLGTPGVQETDPSIFLAVIAPLLFGYMFGDVGHGAVVMLTGLVLRRRYPLLGLLVPGGAAAIVFGLLFGEVFTIERILPALWVRPLDAPLVILFVPLVAGGIIIALGLVLNGLTAIWRRTFGRWLLRELGLVVAYGALWASLLDPRLLLLVAAGMLWFVGGHLTDRFRPPVSRIMQGIGSLTENALRLFINTISFVRVGAFALAHAGLAVAVANLAAAAGPAGQWPVLILGNLMIVAIEGLVVSVQTTRLILFEFFIRFLQATGRPFRPSLPPEWAGAAAQ